MDVFVYLVAAVVIIALIFILSFIKNKNKKAVDDEGGAAVVNAPRREAAPVLAGGVRVRNRRGRMQRARDESDEEGEMFGEDEFEHVALPDGKIGAKKMKKLQEKEEKRRNREADLAEREERKEQDKLREEQRKKEENRRAQEEKKNEEEANRLKEEEEARELEEYLKLKAEFEVHEEGTQEEHFDEDGDSLLQRFVNYIQDMKVVMLEDLAGHFKLKTQDCIDRIKNLQDEGRLSGVLDDRGKFIHITKEEYEAVAKFIKQRGRVSITDLAESSNNLINLNPDNQETHKKLVTEVSS